MLSQSEKTKFLSRLIAREGGAATKSIHELHFLEAERSRDILKKWLDVYHHQIAQIEKFYDTLMSDWIDTWCHAEDASPMEMANDGAEDRRVIEALLTEKLVIAQAIETAYRKAITKVGLAQKSLDWFKAQKDNPGREGNQPGSASPN